MTTLPDCTILDDHAEGNPCPVHGTPHRKIYTYGSTMTGETDVCTFRGCGCAVSIKHDPVGTYPASIMYHDNFDSASGRGRLHAQLCAAKYR
jgi:hypothetical protein